MKRCTQRKNNNNKTNEEGEERDLKKGKGKNGKRTEGPGKMEKKKEPRRREGCHPKQIPPVPRLKGFHYWCKKGKKRGRGTL